MPRGIPKDPNHPRNKKRQETSGMPGDAPAAPKRRGRPPGSGKKQQEAKAAKSAAKAVIKSAPKIGLGEVAKIPSSPSLYDVHSLQAGLNALTSLWQAGYRGGSLDSAIDTYVTQLAKIASPEEEDKEEEPAEVAETAPVVTQSTAPTTNNGPSLPPPPAFVPPPFPSQS